VLCLAALLLAGAVGWALAARPCPDAPLGSPRSSRPRGPAVGALAGWLQRRAAFSAAKTYLHSSAKLLCSVFF